MIRSGRSSDLQRVAMKVVPALVLLLSAPALSQSDAVFETEYDVVLTINENQHRSQGTARVENNDVIAIEFQDYKVELRVSLFEADKFIVETSIFERAEENWVRMGNDESGGFGGGVGNFSSFSWNGDGLGLNIAFINSIAKASYKNERALRSSFEKPLQLELLKSGLSPRNAEVAAQNMLDSLIKCWNSGRNTTRSSEQETMTARLGGQTIVTYKTPCMSEFLADVSGIAR